jgi:hypothetical protein
LKLDGDKLTGTVFAGDSEIKIEDAKYKDGEASFKITREMNGNKFAIKYKGTFKGDTFKGDTFKGKREIDRDGQTMARDFEAKRVKDSK